MTCSGVDKLLPLQASACKHHSGQAHMYSNHEGARSVPAWSTRFLSWHQQKSSASVSRIDRPFLVLKQFDVLPYCATGVGVKQERVERQAFSLCDDTQRQVVGSHAGFQRLTGRSVLRIIDQESRCLLRDSGQHHARSYSCYTISLLTTAGTSVHLYAVDTIRLTYEPIDEFMPVRRFYSPQPSTASMVLRPDSSEATPSDHTSIFDAFSTAERST